MAWRNRSLLFLLVLTPPAFCQCESAPSLSWNEAEARVIQRGAVETPELARKLRIQGIVRIAICVSANGGATQIKVVSGHPILIPAALASIEKWRFKTDTPFMTVMEVLFSQGSTPAEIAEEQKVNNRFFEEDLKCLDAYSKRRYEAALPICKGAVELVERLPKERANERRAAYGNLGNVYFGLRRFEEALSQYQIELRIGQQTLGADEVELGDAYHDVALALHALGRHREAAENYAKAEQTTARALEHIQLGAVKPRYAAKLQKIRGHYLALLKQTGQTAAAAELEKRMR